MTERTKPMLTLAWRDLRHSGGQAWIALAIVAMSVATFTGVGGAAGAFSQALREEQRSVLAADISVEMYENSQPAQMAALASLAGVDWTTVTAVVAQARSKERADPVTAVIRGIDPNVYPFYGRVSVDPPQQLAEALARDGAVVSRALLDELGARVGDRLAIGDAEIKIAASMEAEADRFAGMLSSGQRLLVSSETLERTGAVRSAELRFHRVLVRLHQGAAAATVEHRLEEIFTDADVVRIDEVYPLSEETVEQAGRWLSRIAWLALAIAAAALAVVPQDHTAARLERITSLKMLGARPRQIAAYLMAQFVMIGGAGGAAGAAVGLGMPGVLLWAGGITGSWDHGWGSAAIAIVTGTGVGLALTMLWAFAEVRRLSWTRPASVLKIRAEGTPARVLRGRLLRWPAVRHGLWNLVDGGGATGTVGRWTPAIAIAVVTMLATVGAFAQRIAADELARGMPVERANILVSGFPGWQLEDMHALLARYAEGPRLEIFNLAWMWVGERDTTERKTMVRCVDGIEGAELEEATAQRLGVRRGSALRLMPPQESEVTLEVKQVRRLPATQQMWNAVVTPCGAIQAEHWFHVAQLRTDPDRAALLMGELRARFPAVGVSDTEYLQHEFDRLTRVSATLIRVLNLAAIAGAILAVAAMVAGSARRRQKQIAIFRALGADRAFIRRMVLSEFAALGLAAGAVGSVGAVVAINLVVRIGMGIPTWDLHPGLLVVATAGATALSCAIGWIHLRPFLGQRLLDILRNRAD